MVYKSVDQIVVDLLSILVYHEQATSTARMFFVSTMTRHRICNGFPAL